MRARGRERERLRESGEERSVGNALGVEIIATRTFVCIFSGREPLERKCFIAI